MGVKIIKERKSDDYTFRDNNNNNIMTLDSSASKTNLNAEKDIAKPNDDGKKVKGSTFRLQQDNKINKLKHRSTKAGGRGMQGHSPVYE